MEKRLTEKEYLKMAIELAKETNKEDLKGYFEKKLEQLSNKRKSVGKDNEVNMAICDLLIETLSQMGESTITQLIKNEKVAKYTYVKKVDGEDIQVNITNQKATSVLNNLAKDKIVTELKKGVSYYSIKQD